jgi:hypothetical protein
MRPKAKALTEESKLLGVAREAEVMTGSPAQPQAVEVPSRAVQVNRVVFERVV